MDNQETATIASNWKRRSDEPHCSSTTISNVLTPVIQDSNLIPTSPTLSLHSPGCLSSGYCSGADDESVTMSATTNFKVGHPNLTTTLCSHAAIYDDVMSAYSNDDANNDVTNSVEIEIDNPQHTVDIAYYTASILPSDITKTTSNDWLGENENSSLVTTTNSISGSDSALYAVEEAGSAAYPVRIFGPLDAINLYTLTSTENDVGSPLPFTSECLIENNPKEYSLDRDATVGVHAEDAANVQQSTGMSSVTLFQLNGTDDIMAGHDMLLDDVITLSDVDDYDIGMDCDSNKICDVTYAECDVAKDCPLTIDVSLNDIVGSDSLLQYRRSNSWSHSSPGGGTKAVGSNGGVAQRRSGSGGEKSRLSSFRSHFAAGRQTSSLLAQSLVSNNYCNSFVREADPLISNHSSHTLSRDVSSNAHDALSATLKRDSSASKFSRSLSVDDNGKNNYSSRYINRSNSSCSNSSGTSCGSSTCSSRSASSSSSSGVSSCGSGDRSVLDDHRYSSRRQLKAGVASQAASSRRLFRQGFDGNLASHRNTLGASRHQREGCRQTGGGTVLETLLCASQAFNPNRGSDAIISTSSTNMRPTSYAAGDVLTPGRMSCDGVESTRTSKISDNDCSITVSDGTSHWAPAVDRPSGLLHRLLTGEVEEEGIVLSSTTTLNMGQTPRATMTYDMEEYGDPDILSLLQNNNGSDVCDQELSLPSYLMSSLRQEPTDNCGENKGWWEELEFLIDSSARGDGPAGQDDVPETLLHHTDVIVSQLFSGEILQDPELQCDLDSALESSTNAGAELISDGGVVKKRVGLSSGTSAGAADDDQEMWFMRYFDNLF